ncbi:hypothetical protein FJZ53_00930 [Candidatus Woesearchaeota archaeon]|nr:hypothetical protein [Candidatus Woesearchaeota archaeon]
MKVPNIFLPERSLEVNIRGLLEQEKTIPLTNFMLKENIKFIHDLTFAGCIAYLKEQGQKPFTFFDNITARIIDYELHGKNSTLFNTQIDSVTGIAYKAKSAKFKIVQRSSTLENIQQGFDEDFIPINYDAEQGIELDITKDKYNQRLTRKEAENHKFWLAAMNNDKDKLAEYVDFVFNGNGRKRMMGVYLRSNTSQDELFELSLGNDAYRSDISGNFYFCSSATLLLFDR